MERIKLSKREKHVLMSVRNGWTRGLGELDRPAIESLRARGLVKGIFTEQGDPLRIDLSELGKAYLFENPRLRNPINWSAFAAIAAAISSVGVILGLIIACVKL